MYGNLAVATMRVAVTGAAGLIGGIVYDRLVAAEHSVIGIDRPHDDWLASGRNSDDRAAPSRVDIHLDLATASVEEMSAVLDGAEVLVHLAADANPSNDDDSMLRNNIRVTTTLLRAAKESGIRRVVVASSGLAQVGMEELFGSEGAFSGAKIGVLHGVAPTSLYGMSKIFAEQLAEMYARLHGMEMIAVRIGTVIPDETEHWRRGGRLQATAFLAEDVRNFFLSAVETDILTWDQSSFEGHPDTPGYLLTAAQSDSPGMFVDLEPGLTALGWHPVVWPVDAIDSTEKEKQEKQVEEKSQPEHSSTEPADDDEG